MTDSSTVLGLNFEGVTKAYPLDILQWHEGVNDRIDNQLFLVSYATLSGSGIAFDRRVDGNVLEFRISGLLFNSNTILFDRQSDSHWLQFQKKGVNGLFSGTNLQIVPLFEMNWGSWKKYFPSSQVLNNQTGFNRPYQTYPYGDYLTNDSKILFDLEIATDSIDQRLPFKEKVLGVVVNDLAKVYQFKHFPTSGFGVVDDEFNGQSLAILGSQETGTLIAFSRESDGNQLLSFQVDLFDNQIVITDNRGTKFDLFGIPLENGNTRPLTIVESHIAFWFSWATFYPDIDIYE